MWSFNPSHGSHFGGVWERCIRTTRKILRALLREQITDDESLATLMCEVESILNGRPITTISSDPRDQEPLTPNHLLLLRSEPSMPPGLFRRGSSVTTKVETGPVSSRHLLEKMDQRVLASSSKQAKMATPQKKFSC